jgi:hypothetical protein
MFKLTADNIFRFFNEENLKLYASLKNIEEDIIFKGDITCLRDGLTKSDLITKHQKCKGCYLISIFFSADTISDKIKILTGRKKNYILMTHKSNKDLFKLIYNNKPNSYLDIYNKKIGKYYKEEEHTNLVKFFGSNNKILNLSIITIILTNLMKEKSYPSINNFVYHYICGNRIRFFNFKYDIDSFEELAVIPNQLEKETTRKILIQIIIFFKFFSSYYFLHNQPSIEFIKFDIDLVSFTINNKHIISPIKVFIEPSVYSSITLYNKDTVKRFYNSVGGVKNISDLPFEDFDIDVNGSENYNENVFNIEYIEGYINKRIIFYKIGNRADDFIEMRRHMGIPLASKSFDIVCFLVSLLLNNYFYESFMKNYKSIVIWKGLWKKSEYDKLMEELAEWRETKFNNFELVLLIVKKYYIRFDALEYLFKSFI